MESCYVLCVGPSFSMWPFLFFSLSSHLLYLNFQCHYKYENLKEGNQALKFILYLSYFSQFSIRVGWSCSSRLCPAKETSFGQHLVLSAVVCRCSFVHGSQGLVLLAERDPPRWSHVHTMSDTAPQTVFFLVDLDTCVSRAAMWLVSFWTSTIRSLEPF